MSNITEKSNIQFSNPRLRAEFNDWPLGGSKRGYCRFDIEFNGKLSYRAVRLTINPKTGVFNKPKINTYGGQAAIIDGSDGKTYIVQYAAGFDFINIWRSDFMSAGSAFPRDLLYHRFAELIEEANS